MQEGELKRATMQQIAEQEEAGKAKLAALKAKEQQALALAREAEAAAEAAKEREAAALAEVAKEDAGSREMEDLLWMVFMHPEFQIIR